jgi:hypothetical protein
MTPKLQRTRDGRMLCKTHATSGAPMFHTEGCCACAEARAKGIIRPDITSVTRRQRSRCGYQVSQRGWVDWDKGRAAKAAIEKARAER